MSHAHRALFALILVAGVAAHPGQAKADALAQKNKCTFFTEADAERALHGPVVFLPNSVDPTICSWGLAKDSSIGVVVTRGSRSDWYPPKPGDMATTHARHVKGIGEDAYTSYENAGYGGVYDAQVLTSKGVTDVTLNEKAGNAATALAIARSMMNR